MKQSNKFLSHLQEQESNEGNSSHWILITLIIIASIAFIAGCVYGYIRYKQYKVYVEYSQRPEQGIPRENIGVLQRNKFRFWKFFEEDKAQVIVQQKENYYGKYIELRFTCKSGDICSIRGEKSFPQDKISYYEIEIEDNPRKSDIAIGFCTSKEFQSQFELGRSQTSVGFHSATGEVFWKSKLHQSHSFQAVYGESLGLGIRQKDGRVWISYNGKFLNPPPLSEIKKNDENEKKKEEEEEEVDEELQERMKQIEEQRKKLVLAVQPNLEIYPVISVNGPCKINLNIGGMQFRMNQKELKHGLLH